MNKIIDSFHPKGTISIPASSSFSNRFLISAFIANKQVTLNNVSNSEETLLFIKALETLGAVFQTNGSTVKFIRRERNIRKQIIIDCGSYLSIFRMIFPMAASLYQNVIFKGTEEVINSPLEIYDDICDRQGIKLVKDNGKLELKGTMSPIDMKIRGDVSSDFISGLLFMFAAGRSQNYIYPINGVVSNTYIKLTLDALEKFGYTFEVNEHYYKLQGKGDISDTHFEIEMDFSILASYAVLGCLRGGLSIKDVPTISMQGDFKIFDILNQSGANFVYKDGLLEINKSELKPINADIDSCMDLTPSLLVLASCINGESIIKGLHHLSQRVRTLVTGMVNQITKTGVKIGWQEDEIHIIGDNKEGGYEYDTYSNHRIFIALAMLSIIKKGRSILTNMECLESTYPEFFETLDSLKQ